MVFRTGLKAKHHFFPDIPITDVLQPAVPECGKQSAGTKVVITMGPSCQDVETLVRMLEEGVTCARIDLTWGTMEYHRRSLANLNAAMQRTRRLCSVWLDTTGREMVVRRPLEYDEVGWPWPGRGQKLKAERGQAITVTTDPTAEASESIYPVSYPAFPGLVEPGTVLQVGRYLATAAEGASLFLEVKHKTEDAVVCEAKNDAVLDGLLLIMICHRSGAEAELELPLLTQHDVNCIKTFGSEYEIDFVSLSYCNSGHDVHECRVLLDSLGMSQTKIAAKMERKAALRNFSEIMAAADGVVFSRGNLGLDFDAEVMAMLQKRAINLCNRIGKPVILTRIVDTMSPRPTRAEATDVANAVLDGVDGVLLGAETLRGLYPVDTVRTVLRLAHSAEMHFDYKHHAEALGAEGVDYQDEEEGAEAYADLPALGHSFGVSPTYALTSASAPDIADRAAEGKELDSARSGLGIADGPGGGTFGPAAAENGPQPATEIRAFGSTLFRGPSGGISPPHSPPTRALSKPPLPGPVSPPKYTSSFGNLQLALLAGVDGGLGGKGRRSYSKTVGLNTVGPTPQLQGRPLRGRAPLSRVERLESMALSATRTAEKINAGLVVVMTQSGRTASLVAKYRPPMPVLAVVVPTLKSDGLGWKLEGKYLARQCLIIRGVVPMLAAPMSEGSDDLLSEAIFLATHQRLAKPGDYVVCIQSSGGALAIKVVQVNKEGTGIKLMTEHANQLVLGEDPDIISSYNPRRVSAFVACPGAMTPRVGLPFESPFSATPRFSFRGAAPLATTALDGHAILTEGSVYATGGAAREARTALSRGSATGGDSMDGGPGGNANVASPSTAAAGASSPGGGEAARPAVGNVLPMLGRRASSVLAKYPGLPPLPLPTSPEARSEQ